MKKDNKVNIKLEVCRNKASGKLVLIAHFDAKAPNVLIEKNEFSWIPTSEERDLLDEAFKFMPLDNIISFSEEISPEALVKKEEQMHPESRKRELKTFQEIKPNAKEIKQSAIAPIKKIEELDSTDVNKQETKTTDINEENKNEKEDMTAQNDLTTSDESNPYKLDDQTNEEDIRIIVKSDEEAIEAALKKHAEKDDSKSIVEGDEQSIIDKVLSQKKKGKWRRY
jgi:hypothetical protein